MERETLRAEVNLQRLYQQLLPTVYRAAYTYLKNPSDSEDAAQEAFLRLVQSRRRFSDERQVKAWLIVTVGNIAKDMLRRRSRGEVNLDDHPELPAPSHDSGELLAALLALPEKWKTAMYLYYFEGYSVREIARAMGQQEGTVKSWLHRARGMLREALEEDV